MAVGVGGRCHAPTLSKDMTYEVLRRVDAVTLAAASCVCSEFRSMASDEALWESLCSFRWPSTRDPEVKAIIFAVGGFRRFYSQCYPLIVNKEANLRRGGEYGPGLGEDWWDEEDDEVWEPKRVSSNELVSIVDVVFDREPVFSRTIQGIPGAYDFQDWFSNCPFRIDLLKSPDEDDGGRVEQQVSISGQLPCVESVSRERREGKLWKCLWDSLRVSWIVVNKRSKQMANVASWSPLGGLRHWPYDEDFLIRFGCILPAPRDAAFRAVQCNIVMKCSFSNSESPSGAISTSLALTELSMQLENMDGTHLNGRDSLAILHQALSCPRSKQLSQVQGSYHKYVKVQSELKEEKLRYEGRLDTAAVVSALGAFMWLWYIMV